MLQLKGIELKRFLKKIKKPNMELYLLLENIQYARNIASIFRTAEAFAVKKLFLTGISRTPPFGKELRKVSRSKEARVSWEYYENTGSVITKLKKQNFKTIGLEIADEAKNIDKLRINGKILLIVGNENYGISRNTLEKVDECVFIPIYGKGSSLSVGVACGIAIYEIINKSFNEK